MVDSSNHPHQAAENDPARIQEPNRLRESVGAGSQDDFVLRLYLRDLGRFARLPVREESELLWLASFGDEPARDRLVLGNLRLVVHIALTYHHAQLPVSDLTLEEVGDTLRYVRQGIRNIESAALAKLRRRAQNSPPFVK